MGRAETVTTTMAKETPTSTQRTRAKAAARARGDWRPAAVGRESGRFAGAALLVLTAQRPAAPPRVAIRRPLPRTEPRQIASTATRSSSGSSSGRPPARIASADPCAQPRPRSTPTRNRIRPLLFTRRSGHRPHHLRTRRAPIVVDSARTFSPSWSATVTAASTCPARATAHAEAMGTGHTGRRATTSSSAHSSPSTKPRAA